MKMNADWVNVKKVKAVNWSKLLPVIWRLIHLATDCVVFKPKIVKK